jgi:hypothetical protein
MVFTCPEISNIIRFRLFPNIRNFWAVGIALSATGLFGLLHKMPLNNMQGGLRSPNTLHSMVHDQTCFLIITWHLLGTHRHVHTINKLHVIFVVTMAIVYGNLFLFLLKTVLIGNLWFLLVLKLVIL